MWQVYKAENCLISKRFYFIFLLSSISVETFQPNCIGLIFDCSTKVTIYALGHTALHPHSRILLIRARMARVRSSKPSLRRALHYLAIFQFISPLSLEQVQLHHLHHKSGGRFFFQCNLSSLSQLYVCVCVCLFFLRLLKTVCNS